MIFIKNLASSLLFASSLLALRASDPLDTWVEIPKPATAGALTSIVYGNGTFVAVGSGKTIITSSDGALWSQQSSPAAADPLSVKFVNAKFFVFEDHHDANSQTMISDDGIH